MCAFEHANCIPKRTVRYGYNRMRRTAIEGVRSSVESDANPIGGYTARVLLQLR